MFVNSVNNKETKHNDKLINNTLDNQNLITYIPKITVLNDGNCLFRCFSYFLHDTEKFHMSIRLLIADNIVNKWLHYQPFIVGNTYYNNVKNSSNYYNLMTRWDWR